jgi:hypothetical protein
MPIHAQSNSLEVDHDVGNHESHDTHGGTRPMMLVKKAFISLILNDHVVHNHTSGYHLPHGLVATCSSRVSKTSPMTLEHTKCLLHIFPTNFFVVWQTFYFSLM